MRRIILLLILFLPFSVFLFGQTQSDVLQVHDTRTVRDNPSFLKKSMRLDLKNRSVMSVPGKDTYAAILSLAPWSDYTAGNNYQLAFTPSSGLWYRTGNPSSSSWNIWRQVLIEDEDRDFTLGNYYKSQNIGPGSRLHFRGATQNNNPLWISRYNVDTDVSELRVNIGTWADGKGRFVIGFENNQKVYNKLFYFNNKGQLGIKTDNPRYELDVNGTIHAKAIKVDLIGIKTDNPRYELDVNGTIHAKAIKVDLTGWADFVFAKDYSLLSLSEVKAYIEDKKHLPGVPSETEIGENGIDVGELQTIMIQKVEELTLYTIQQQDLIEKLEKIILQQEDKLNDLEEKIHNLNKSIANEK